MFFIVEQITNPQVFPLIPTGQEGNSNIIMGCLAKNYFPNPLSVVWGKTSGDTLPGEKNMHFTVSEDPLRYSLVSQFSVSSSEWNSNNYSCDVRHFSSSITRIIPKSCVLPPESPTVHILQGSCFSNTDDQIELSCQAYNLTSQDASIKWFINEQESFLPQDLLYLENINNFYGLHSTVSISQAQWNNGARIKCQVTDTKTGKSSEATARKCSDSINHLGIEVIMIPPTIEELYVHETARIPCVAYNLKQVPGHKFHFDYPGAAATLNEQTEDPQLNQNGTYSVTSILTVSPETWESNTEITCIFNFPGLPEAIIRRISKKTETYLIQPNVVVFPPSPEDIAKDEYCTITCIAKDYYPIEVFMGWTENNMQVFKDQYVNSESKRLNRNQSYSASSLLSVPCSKWKEGNSYGCLVGHQAIPLKFITKVIDKYSGKPTSVNVSVNMSETTLSCY